MIRKREKLLHEIRSIHEEIRDRIVDACEKTSIEDLSRIVSEEGGDTIFAIDRIPEDTLLEKFSAIAREWPCRIVAEGLRDPKGIILPSSASPADLEITIIIDPIDGTRGLMHQKRPAWILTGIAPSLDGSETLADMEIAVQTEIPLLKQHLSDCLYAAAGKGITAERFNRLTGERVSFTPRPSAAGTIAQGYGSISRFFPGTRSLFAAIDDELVEAVLGPPAPGRALSFEDQYISTAGQLYELIMGHDRWTADLRALADGWLQEQGKPPSLTCHPYDLCTELIARETGVIVTDPMGNPLESPLDTETGCAWLGFANRKIAGRILPVLQALLQKYLAGDRSR